MTTESQIETSLIDKLNDLKYTYCADIRDRDGLEKNFRDKFETLNRVNLTDSEFARLMDEIISSDVLPLRSSCGSAILLSGKTVHRSTIPWSTSKTGVKIPMRW